MVICVRAVDSYMQTLAAHLLRAPGTVGTELQTLVTSHSAASWTWSCSTHEHSAQIESACQHQPEFPETIKSLSSEEIWILMYVKFFGPAEMKN